MQAPARGRRPIDEITSPQRHTLRELRRFISERWFPPTIKELAQEPAELLRGLGLFRNGVLWRAAKSLRKVFGLKNDEHFRKAYL